MELQNRCIFDVVAYFSCESYTNTGRGYYSFYLSVNQNESEKKSGREGRGGIGCKLPADSSFTPGIN
jgi:hypothetical protein